MRQGLSRARWRLDGGLRGVDAIVHRLAAEIQQLQREHSAARQRFEADQARLVELAAAEQRTAAVLHETRAELRRISHIVEGQSHVVSEQLAGHTVQIGLLSDAVHGLQASGGAAVEGGLAAEAAPPRRPTAVVATDVGVLTLPASDRIMLPWLRRFGTWEDGDTLRRMLRPGATFVDVGAHVGYVTLLASRAVGSEGRVVAIEPDAENFDLLEQNVAHARLTNVVAHRVAAWDRPAVLRLRRSATNSGDHRIATDDEDGDMVSCATVDSLLDGARCDVVKIDVQGVEHVAVRGMVETIRRCRPLILVEFSPADIASTGARALEVLASYRELGYEPCLVGSRSGASLSDRGIVAAAFRDPRQWLNLVLRPVEPPAANGAGSSSSPGPG